MAEHTPNGHIAAGQPGYHADHSAAVHEALFDLVSEDVIGELHADIAAGSHDVGRAVPHDRRRPSFDR